MRQRLYHTEAQRRAAHRADARRWYWRHRNREIWKKRERRHREKRAILRRQARAA